MSFRRRLLLASNNNEPVDYEKQYFTVEALEAGTLKYDYSDAASGGGVAYVSVNNGDWNELGSNAALSVDAGDKVRIKMDYIITPSYQYSGEFTLPKCNIYGNIMSLSHGDDFIGVNYSLPYTSMFASQPVVHACNLILPATYFGAHSNYKSMFSACPYLVDAPELPATELRENCYYEMFSGCSSLVTAPELPATTLTDYCYEGMFYGCTSLTTAPELPATKLAECCYQQMFSGCSSLVTAPVELPATTLTDSCYAGMFWGCTSLITAPELPATTLAKWCYHWMLRDCTSLNNIKMLATDISAEDCLYQWVDNVASTGTFVKHKDMTSMPSGSSGIPSGWTVVDALV